MLARLFIAAVAVLPLALLARAQGLGAAPPPPTQMPAMGAVPMLGRATGGVDPARMQQILSGARDAAPVPDRGIGQQALFDRFARSVVLIVTKDALGSGTVVAADGSIVTNARIVHGLTSVGVIFKPLERGAGVREADAVQAKIARIDDVTDLAVIRVAKLPNDVRPVPVGPLATAGAGVHAIGHPFGEMWTYTQGVVSGVTANYSWASDDGLKHRADVVRMHMPTNPGNSGASFLNDAGELVGVNGFSHMQGSDVNFAIAATDARRVLAARADRLAPVKADAVPRADKAAYCAPVRLSTSRSKANDATQFLLDTNCDGRGDATLSVPDSRARPTTLAADTNGNGKTDVTYVDENNDLKFDKALYDTNEDGATDMIGYDLNDSLEPGRIVLARA